MAQQRLDLADVVTGFQQMGRKAVTKDVSSDPLGILGISSSLGDLAV